MASVFFNITQQCTWLNQELSPSLLTPNPVSFTFFMDNNLSSLMDCLNFFLSGGFTEQAVESKEIWIICLSLIHEELIFIRKNNISTQHLLKKHLHFLSDMYVLYTKAGCYTICFYPNLFVFLKLLLKCFKGKYLQLYLLKGLMVHFYRALIVNTSAGRISGIFGF